MSDTKRKIRTLGEYQRQMERFEKSDGTTLPDIYLAIRIDAHRTGPEWDDIPDTDYPFAPHFIESLTSTAQDLMCSGFRVLYSFVHGDEITLLFDPSESAAQRRRGRIASLVASYGTVGFLRASHRAVAFHSQLSELPTAGNVIDYFMWQRKVATRNYFSRTLGIAWLKSGMEKRKIEERLSSLSNDEERFSCLDELNIDRKSVTPYHRFGLALWWERLLSADGYRLVVCDQLPESDEHYRDLVSSKIQGEVIQPEIPISEVRRQRMRFVPRQQALRPETELQITVETARAALEKSSAAVERSEAVFRISGAKRFGPLR